MNAKEGNTERNGDQVCHQQAQKNLAGRVEDHEILGQNWPIQDERMVVRLEDQQNIRVGKA